MVTASLRGTPLAWKTACTSETMSCICEAWMFAGLNTPLRSCTNRERVASEGAFCARAADISATSLLVAPGDGFFGPSANASRSLLSCCFCSAVTCEFGFIAARSACNLATGVSAAGCVAFGFVGCCGGAGGGTPCRTLFWSLNSLARCLIMASEPAAKVLAGRKIAKVRETNIGFIRTVQYLQQPASPRPNCQPGCEVIRQSREFSEGRFWRKQSRQVGRAAVTEELLSGSFRLQPYLTLQRHLPYLGAG